MTRVSTKAQVRIYEQDHQEVGIAGCDLSLLVETHWNCEDRVVLTIPGAKPVTVLAADLELAIKRCSR